MKTPLAVLLGTGLGVVLLAGARLVFAGPEEPIHHHANFALFVRGTRVDLSGDEFMEDVAMCASGGTVLPEARVHLHNNDADVVHVHHEGVTWGHLFTNLGFSLGEKHLALGGDSLLVPRSGSTLKFILNGRPQLAVQNELIRSGDRLLVSYGTESEAELVRTQYPRVATNAEEFNRRPDPAGCSGGHEATLWERIRHAFAG